MFRWLMMIAGSVLLALAAMMFHKYPPLPLTPETLSVQQAEILLSEDDSHYVRMSVQLDTDHVIYPTASVRPVYTARPTDQRYPLGLAAGLPSDVFSFLGTVVHITTPLEAEYLRLQILNRQKGKADEVLRERLLAPVRGCGLSLWALSPVFKADEAAGKSWLRAQEHEGPLTRLAELKKNIPWPELEHDLKDILAVAEKEYGQAIPEDALLLITDYSWDFKPRRYYPVAEGMGGRLFVMLPHETVPGEKPFDVTGILYPDPSHLYDDFATVLDVPVPARIGVITTESAASYNRRRAGNAKGTAAAGLALLLAGLGGTGLRKLFRKNRG